MKKIANVLKCLIIYLALMLFPTLGNAQSYQQYGTPFNVPDLRDMNMYQVHIRPFSQDGNLAGITSKLDHIQSMGINVIYLMPINPHGTDPKSTPSPYCIKDFNAVATEYGNLNDLRTLVDGAHARNMAVILDVAINGTSWDHEWITSKPQYYIKNGSEISQLGPYADVAALDLSRQDVRNELKQMLEYWVLEANVDGFRCDYANNPTVEFWSEIISHLKAIPNRTVLMFAEGDRQENFDAGFDLNFGDRWFYNGLKNVAQGGPASTRLSEMNNYEYAKASGNQQVVRYTGNHDTYTNDNGSHRPFAIFNNHDGIVVNFLVSAYMKGVPFLMSGQEIDYEPTTHWPWTGFKFDWNQNPTAKADFSKILNFRKENQAIRRGELEIFHSDDFAVFTKTLNEEKILIIANLRNSSKTYRIPNSISGDYTNVFTSDNKSISTNENITLNGYEYLVLKSGESEITVNNAMFSPNEITILKGQNKQLDIITSPSQVSNNKFNWSSDDEQIATVDANGVVYAINVGTTTIRANYKDGNIEATATINVEEAEYVDVYFYKPNDWGQNINIYWWEPIPENSVASINWPGTAMENQGDGWYKFSFLGIDFINLIFNDGDNQTENLSRTKKGWYKDNNWYDQKPEICADAGIQLIYKLNNQSFSGEKINAEQGDKLELTPTASVGGNWSWILPNGSSTSNQEIVINQLAEADQGEYIAIFTDNSNCKTYVKYKVSFNDNLFFIQNRWQDKYIKESNGLLIYTDIDINDKSMQWIIEEYEGEYYTIQNVQSGNYINIEDVTGFAQVLNVDNSFWSAHWKFIDNEGYNIIQNRWHDNQLIHIEDLLENVQSSSLYDGSHSCHWIFNEYYEVVNNLSTMLNNSITNNNIEISYNRTLKSVEVINYGSGVNISIYNLSGNLIQSQYMDAQTTATISCSTMPSGLYLIKIEGNNKVFKFLVE